MPWAVLLGWLVFLSAAVPSVGLAAKSVPEDAVKAAYLYRFAGYVQWPEPGGDTAPFTIAVLGSPGVAGALAELLPNHPIKNAIAQVREITNIRDLGNAQILYMGSGQAKFVRAAELLDSRATLFVSDEDRGLELGSVVNFLTLDHRVRFEVSLTAADRSGLKISSELLAVALRVQGGRRQSGEPILPAAAPSMSPDMSRKQVATNMPGWPE
jgi:hypothetical protein